MSSSCLPVSHSDDLGEYYPSTQSLYTGSQKDTPLKIDMTERQVALEAANLEQFRMVRDRRLRSDIKSGRYAETMEGRSISSLLLSPLSQALEDYRAKTVEGRVGVKRDEVAAHLIGELTPEVTALIFLSTLLNLLSMVERGQPKPVMLSAFCRHFAGNCLDELAVREAFAIRPKMVKAMMADAKSKASPRLWTKRAMGNYVNFKQPAFVTRFKHVEGFWGNIGAAVLEVASALHLVQIVTIYKDKRSYYHVYPTNGLVLLMEEAARKGRLVSTDYDPMVCPPRPWGLDAKGAAGREYGADFFVGGYLTGHIRPYPFVKAKGQSRKMVKDVRRKSADMRTLLTQVNALQNTAWHVNPVILSVMEELWFNRRGNIAGLPNAVTLEEKLAGGHVLPDDKLSRFKEIDEDRRNLSLRLYINRMIAKAKAFGHYDEIYMPYSVDSRGRVYAIPVALNPQGPDYQKALLEFAQGKPISSRDRSWYWLAVGIANTYGKDKLSLDDRVEWVKANQDLILSVATNPLTDLRWTTVSEPWQFLRGCLDWKGWKDQGDGFLSHWAVAVDATCSGLQVYSMLFKDEVGGRSVNLVPGLERQDIYGDVANRVKDRLREILVTSTLVQRKQEAREVWNDAIAVFKAQGFDMQLLRPTVFNMATKDLLESYKGEDALIEALTQAKKAYNKVRRILGRANIARHLLTWDFDRSATKRQVMTLPYAATQRSCFLYTRDYLSERIKSGEALPHGWFKKDFDNHAMLLSDNIWAAIGEVVVKAKEGMTWFQASIREYVKKNPDKPFGWYAPDGLFCFQAKWDMDTRRVETFLNGEMIKPSFEVETDEVDPRGMAQAVAPNIIHSIDAAILRAATGKAITRQEPLRHFAFIHDSFGVHAADMEVFLNECLKPAFVEIFKSDILSSLKDSFGTELPPPSQGNLDLDGVLSSQFCFS